MEKQAGLETRERVRINCERYRSSPPICSTSSLTDSQKREVQALDEQRLEQEQAEERERRYRWIRRTAITWMVLALIGIGLLIAFAVLRQTLAAVIMLQPLSVCVLDALKAIHEWRHFDD